MSKIKKMFLASVSLFGVLTFNSSVMGMDISQLKDTFFIYDCTDPRLYTQYDLNYFNKIDLEKIKKRDGLLYLLNQGFLELNEKGEFLFSRSNYDLDNSYVCHFLGTLLNRENYENLIVENNKLRTYDEFKKEYDALNKACDDRKEDLKLGYKIFYLMLKNMCMEWLQNSMESSEGNCNCEIESLTPDYVKNYIMKSLSNGRKAYLATARMKGEYGLLFDGNIFVSDFFDLPCFSYELDKSAGAVTFRFFKKQDPDGKKFMIQIQQLHYGLYATTAPSFNIIFYDHAGNGHWIYVDADLSWKKISEDVSNVVNQVINQDTV